MIFTAVILLLVARFSAVLTGSAYPLSVVSSDSMRPSLNKGDIVPWIPCSIEKVKVGDVVIYRSVHGYLMIHRVVDIRNGKLITRGDANNYTDQEGPHVPEPLIGDENLCGKAIMVGGKPLKIPLAGYFWLSIKEMVSKMATPIKWGRPQPAFHYMVFTPFIFSTLLFLLLFSIWIPNGKSLKEKLHEMIFGPERMSARSAMVYIMALFIPFLLITSFFSYDHVSLEKKMKKFEEGIPVYNPSFVKIRGVIFAEGGNISLGENIFSLKSGDGKIIKYEGSRGEIYLYSSPYWSLLPSPFMHYFYDFSPRVCILASSIFSGLLLSFITLLLLLIISLLAEAIIMVGAYLSFSFLSFTPHLKPLYNFAHSIKNKINIMVDGIKHMAMWSESVGRRIFFVPLATLLFIPMLFDGVVDLILTTFISSIVLASLSYFLGARFKNEMAIVSIISSFIISTAFVSRMVLVAGLNLTTFIEYVSLTFIIAILLFIMEFPIMLLTASIIHRIRENVNPLALIEVCDL